MAAVRVESASICKIDGDLKSRSKLDKSGPGLTEPGLCTRYELVLEYPYKLEEDGDITPQASPHFALMLGAIFKGSVEKIVRANVS